MPWLRFGPWVGARVASQHCPIFRPSRLDFNNLKLVSHWNRNFSLDSFYIAGVDATSNKCREASYEGADGVVGSTTDYSVV